MTSKVFSTRSYPCREAPTSVETSIAGDLCSTNDVGANMVFRNIDLHFEGKQNNNFNISKTVRANANMYGSLL